MSKKIRKNRFSEKQERKRIPIGSMAHFCKTTFGAKVDKLKLDAMKSNSKRRVVISTRKTGKTFFIVNDILHKALSNPHQRIVVGGPQKVHIEEIFLRLREAVYGNKDVELMLRRDVSAPFFSMEFSNGSRIRGFALGTGDNSRNGVSVRGQDADHIYIDEFTSCSKRSYTGAILPMLQTAPDTHLTMVGSPPFMDYDWSTRDLDTFERFHWKKDISEEMRSHFSQETWYRDVEGVWDDYTRS